MIPWYALALGSAVVWGFHYVMLENAMKYITPPTALVITCLPIFLIVGLWYEQFIVDVKTIMSVDWKTRAQILTIFFTSMSATLMLYYALQMKSATHAALLEITYPIFVALFTFVVFGVSHLTVPTAIGAAMILGGSMVVIWFN